jgi:hypothetical protein
MSSSTTNTIGVTCDTMALPPPGEKGFHGNQPREEAIG